VVQFEPNMNPELLFNIEDVFLPSSTISSSSAVASNDFLTSTLNLDMSTQSLLKTTNQIEFDDDFIIDQDFTDANILLDSKLNDNYSNKIINRQKSARK
jgi:hypothetical protein